MSETLYIKNFGGIFEATYQVNPKLTVIIGPEASGKSITAKLLNFFKSSMHDAIIIRNWTLNGRKLTYIERICDEFCHYFPQDYWNDDDFEICYSINSLKFKVQGNKQKGCSAIYPEEIVELADKYIGKHEEHDGENTSVTDLFSEYNKELETIGVNRSSQVFVIASRSVLAVQPDVTLQLATNNPTTLDPVSKAFINLYPALKRMQSRQKDETLLKITDNILKAKYINSGGREYLQFSDNRQVDISSVSSGQQEVLPLVIILRALPLLIDSFERVTLYIEEPEAHLFPSTQKEIVKVIAYLINMLNAKLQVIVTTHSPYVLASFNNLLQASDAIKNGAEPAEVDAILPCKCHLSYEDIYAYSIHDGSITQIMDSETRLIGETSLDGVTETISEEFSKLLDL